jgi:(S)-2-hydroxyglutarate dehydrogenase
MTKERRYDVCVVGGGLVGLATARAIVAMLPGVSLLLLEKEDDVARHQSSHNSGVVHSGLYYKPGSLKAQLCVEGREAVYELSAAAGIDSVRSGKLVIATYDSELDALDELERRGRANGLTGIVRLGSGDITAFEPEAVGVAAIHVPEAGVADFPAMARYLAGELAAAGADVRTGHAVTGIRHRDGGVEITTGGDAFSARVLINCAGLHSDRVAAMAGVRSPVRIVPFRGEYYSLRESASHLVRTLVYPVPDPRFPFLGVHFTRRIDGSVEVGPNAVLAFGREHYRGTRPNWRDLRETLSHPGFRRLARRHWLSGSREMMNSRSRKLYARLARRLVPRLDTADLVPGGSGVRAQAVGPDGALVDDFVIEEAGSTIHVLNAPSPAATASLAIGRHVARRALPMIR